MVKNAIKRSPMYRFLLLLTIASAVGLQGWRTLFNNFAVEQAGVDGFWIGLIQSVREAPGFLALVVIYLLWIIEEHRLSSLSVIVLGFGITLTGLFPSPIGLLVTTLLMSTGFHYFETTNQSLTLQYFSLQDSPGVLARFRSLSAFTNIAIGVIIWVTVGFLPMKILFILIGSAVAVAGLYSLKSDPTDKQHPPQEKRLILKRKYWLFYVLNFLAGARRQIFMVFAVFLLVEHFKFSIQTITILFVVNNVINYFFTPVIAVIINRFGERAVLSIEYGTLIGVFLAYAFIDNAWVCGGLYVLDHLLFNFSIAIKTYFQKNADKKDIAPSMAVSFTINHIAAVVLPVIGGIFWVIDRRLPFIAGAVLSLVSLLFAQKITIPEPVATQPNSAS